MILKLLFCSVFLAFTTIAFEGIKCQKLEALNVKEMRLDDSKTRKCRFQTPIVIDGMKLDCSGIRVSEELWLAVMVNDNGQANSAISFELSEASIYQLELLLRQIEGELNYRNQLRRAAIEAIKQERIPKRASDKK